MSIGSIAARLGAGLAAAFVLTPTMPAQAADPALPEPRTSLYLVTLADEPMTSYDGAVPGEVRRIVLLARQTRLLQGVDAPAPVYRWTTALNGFAVRLTAGQARTLATDPAVALVERNAVRTLAGRPSTAALSRVADAHRTGGAGVVVGLVDSGIWPESPLFAAVPGLGRPPEGFRGGCVPADGWDAGACNRKLVGARWYVAGFGTDRVRTSSYLSARDDHGHGTLVASVAAGNSGVSVTVGGQRLGAFGGTAPQARIAVYKACWTAPDPADDGCSTADLVAAIDDAATDGVDVLSLAVGTSQTLDTVQRALLGATEAGIFVTAAAGNDPAAYAAHDAPWVTTVGAATTAVPGGVVDLGTASLSGAMASRRTVGPVELVDAARIAAPGATAVDSRLCRPGSLDAARAAGRIVLCDRGGLGRVDKSHAVEQADGVGMVLVNTRPDSVEADFHAVPTVHLSGADGQALRRWLATHPGAELSLRPSGPATAADRVAPWSASGDPRIGLVKPDLVAPGVGLVGAAPLAPERWSTFTGTSAATARVAGVAALVASRHPDWSPAMIRSAVTTSARSTAGDPSSLAQGAGLVRARAAVRPGLVYDVPLAAYRHWLDGTDRDLNLPAIKVSGPASVLRSVTNVGARAMYYSVTTRGLTRHEVSVTPLALRLGPGETGTFRVTITGPEDRRVDSGWLSWHGANGIRVRIPLVVAD